MRYFKVLLFFILTMPVLGQGGPVVSASDTIYNAAELEIKPEYPGGLELFFEFVSKNIVLPVADVDKDTRLRVYTSFIVEADGSVSDVKAHRDPGYGLGEEAVRVVGLSSKWKPGEKDGQKVRCRYSLPISIVLKAPEPISDTDIHDLVSLDIKPEYPGGLTAFYDYIIHNIKIPKMKGVTKIKVYAYFVVEKDGSMAHIKVLRDPGHGLAPAVIKVLEEVPEKWSPGIKNGEPIRASFSLPLTINIKQ